MRKASALVELCFLRIVIDRFPGHHVRWWSLEAKDKSSSKESTWGPDDNELLRGVTYVNQNAPEDDSENQQYLWILLNIRPDSGSPIAGSDGSEQESSHGWRDLLPFLSYDNKELETVHGRLSDPPDLSSPVYVRRRNLGMARRWKDASTHHSLSGSWQVPHRPAQFGGCLPWLAPCQGHG